MHKSRRLRALLVSTALVVLCAASAIAQPVATPEDLRRLTEQIMDKVDSGDVDDAFRLLRPRTIIGESEFDALAAQAKLQVALVGQKFGGNLGHELIRQDRVGESLVRYVYLDKFDRYALRWVFYGYKGKGGWIIHTFRLDDQLPAIFP